MLGIRCGAVADAVIILEDAVTSSILLIISVNLLSRYRKDRSAPALCMSLYVLALGMARVCWLFLNGVVRTPVPLLASFALLLTFLSIGFSILFISRTKVTEGLFLLVLSLSLLSFIMFPLGCRERPNGYYSRKPIFSNFYPVFY